MSAESSLAISRPLRMESPIAIETKLIQIFLLLPGLIPNEIESFRHCHLYRGHSKMYHKSRKTCFGSVKVLIMSE